VKIAKNLNILSQKVINKADAICFTSNGILKKNGALIMGAGVAKAFRDNFFNIDHSAGSLVKERGNICQIVSNSTRNPELPEGRRLDIVAFPTKHRPQDKSDIELIKKSAVELVELADMLSWKLVFLPAPGCSNGKLDFETEVKPVIKKILDDRFVITFYDGRSGYVKRR